MPRPRRNSRRPRAPTEVIAFTHPDDSRRNIQRRRYRLRGRAVGPPLDYH